MLSRWFLLILFAFSASTFAVSFSEAVAAYTMENTVSGNLLDISGHGLNSTNGLGSASLVASQYGNALRFTATNNTPVQIADAPSLRMAAAFTIEVRFLIEDTCVNIGGGRTIDWVRVVGKGNDAEHRNYGLWYKENEGWLFQIDPTGPNIATFASIAELAIQRNRWYHLTGVYDGAYLKMYVDGVRVGTDTAISPSQFPLDSSPLTIGGSPTEHSKHVGLVDNVALFNRALTSTEVLQNAQAIPEPNSLLLACLALGIGWMRMQKK